MHGGSGAGVSVACERLVKVFAVPGGDPVPVLGGVSLRVPTGSMVAVMGPSGSGKSTLMYCLAGLEPPTSGEVWLTGVPLSTLNRARLARLRRDRVGFVFQSANLVPTMTVGRPSSSRSPESSADCWSPPASAPWTWPWWPSRGRPRRRPGGRPSTRA